MFAPCPRRPGLAGTGLVDQTCSLWCCLLCCRFWVTGASRAGPWGGIETGRGHASVWQGGWELGAEAPVRAPASPGDPKAQGSGHLTSRGEVPPDLHPGVAPKCQVGPPRAFLAPPHGAPRDGWACGGPWPVATTQQEFFLQVAEASLGSHRGLGQARWRAPSSTFLGGSWVSQLAPWTWLAEGLPARCVPHRGCICALGEAWSG